MKAIVGLGNPGREYAGTRHNIGFDVLDEVARRWHVQLRPWKSVADVAVVSNRGVVLVEPQTYMNRSGDAVSRIAAFHKLEATNVLVVVDEVQLPLGRLRVRRNGSAGGHNGLKSIIQHMGAEFPRLRIGVGRGDPTWDLADHVLSKFGREEREAVADLVSRAADAVELFADEGLAAVMNRFNPPPVDSRKSSSDSEA
ncbi:MAG: aminoacyl-tRNA hydrolase [Vicinamibacterales bacterium]